MRLRILFSIYLIAIHLVFTGVSGYLLRDERLWLVAIEAAFVLSLLSSMYLLKKTYEPIELVRSGAEFIRESDFSMQLRTTGKKELDAIIEVYNQMMTALREERLLLTEKNLLLEKIIHASPAAIIILDFDNRIALLNQSAEKLLGLIAKEVIGKMLAELPSPAARALVPLNINQPEIASIGNGRRFKCTKSEFFDRGFQRAFFILEELTEELRRSEKEAYEKVIRLLSHEVNNSSGAVRSLLQSCLNYAPQLLERDRQDFEQALSVAISRTESLTSFMSGYAQIIKLPKPNVQPADIESLLRNTAKLFQAEAEKRNIQFEWTIEKAAERISLDKAQMEQVFINVVKNAIEAIGNNGKINICIGKQGLKPFVIVEDTGGGISEEAQRNLFTPFFSTKENGQGLGLALVQEILTNHGFEFSLNSTSNKTTQFKIIFNEVFASSRALNLQ